VDGPHIAYIFRPGTAPDAELSALTAVYKFVLFDSQASKGGPHDLIKNPTEECTTSQDKKGKNSADIHGHGL
jgi:hypothetical protein